MAALICITLPVFINKHKNNKTNHGTTKHVHAHAGLGKTFDPSNEPKRVRKNFYDLTDEELCTFMKAVGYMRNELRLENPIQWDNYAKIHALHCTQADADHPPVHWSWHFLPWHRGYLYFLERILADCLNKQGLDGSKFALPYWDWTAQKGMPNTREREAAGLPSPFFGYNRLLENMVHDDGLGFDNSALYEGNRGPTIEKPTMDPNNELSQDSKDHVQETLHYMSEEYVELMLAAPFEQFGGRSVTDRQTGQGLLEQGPHNDGHDWVGTRFGKNRTMGTLRTAAGDPMFYMHHGNIDRIWSLYKQPQPSVDGEWGIQQYNFFDVDGSVFTLSVKEIIEKTTNVSYAPSQVDLTATAVAVSAPKTIQVDQGLTSQAITILVPEDFGSGRTLLVDVHTGPIYHTGKYLIKIYANQENSELIARGDFIGKISIMDGDHRSHHTKETMIHKFSIIMNKIPKGTTSISIVPPKRNNIKVLIKEIQYWQM